MNEPEFENLLRNMHPAAPTHSLEGRIAASLPDIQVVKPMRRMARFGSFAERLLWAGAGAAAMWLTGAMLKTTPTSRTSVPEVAHSPVSSPHVFEEPMQWSDEGVHFVGDSTPARLLHRRVIERHESDDGSMIIQVPREDVILLPVALH